MYLTCMINGRHVSCTMMILINLDACADHDTVTAYVYIALQNRDNHCVQNTACITSRADLSVISYRTHTAVTMEEGKCE